MCVSGSNGKDILVGVTEKFTTATQFDGKSFTRATGFSSIRFARGTRVSLLCSPSERYVLFELKGSLLRRLSDGMTLSFRSPHNSQSCIITHLGTILLAQGNRLYIMTSENGTLTPSVVHLNVVYEDCQSLNVLTRAEVTYLIIKTSTKVHAFVLQDLVQGATANTWKVDTSGTREILDVKTPVFITPYS
jgi:hypothetical protein